MYVCKKCIKARTYWSEGIAKSLGVCEFCGITGICYDKPTSSLTTFVEEAQFSPHGFILPEDNPEILAKAAKLEEDWKNYLSQRKAEGVHWIPSFYLEKNTNQ